MDPSPHRDDDLVETTSICERWSIKPRAPPHTTKTWPRPPIMGHLPRKYEKMQSHQIKMKIGTDTNKSTRNPKMIIPKLENNGKRVKKNQNRSQPPKFKVVRLS